MTASKHIFESTCCQHLPFLAISETCASSTQPRQRQPSNQCIQTQRQGIRDRIAFRDQSNKSCLFLITSNSFRATLHPFAAIFDSQHLLLTDFNHHNQLRATPPHFSRQTACFRCQHPLLIVGTRSRPFLVIETRLQPFSRALNPQNVFPSYNCHLEPPASILSLETHLITDNDCFQSPARVFNHF